MSEWYWENHPGYSSSTTTNTTAFRLSFTSVDLMDVLSRKVEDLCAAVCELERELAETR